MKHCDAFDYWGKGTEVTVSSLTAASPALFPLVQCNSGTADTVTVGCIAQDFFPKSLTFQWTDDSGTTQNSTEYPTAVKDSKYTGVSVLNLSKSEWDSRRNFSCSVTHSGESKRVTLQKPPPPPKVTSKAPITVTLNQPSPKEMFNNNQVKLECIITGQDQNIINDVQISWHIDGQKTTDRITTTNPGGRKISTMTRTPTEWQGVNKVSCSAIRDNMTPVIQDLTVQKGDAKGTKVTVHVLTEEDISKDVSNEVTLVCLVSSPKQQDYYIAWTEDSGQNAGTFTDGINFPPQKTQNGYVVTSVYTTTKKKWDDINNFSCSVWPAGSESKTYRGVSKAHSNSVEYSTPESKLDFALSCIDGAIEADEYSSLWSTTSSFIFLFICSLLYSTIISLVKIK